MIRRSLTALAAALAAELCCVAGSFLHAMRLVAHVDDVSLSAVLTAHRNAALTAWRSSLTVGDRLLFVAVAVLAAAAVLSAPYLKPTFGRIHTRITGVRRLPRV
ncbi:hypothetical protein [Catenulispora pinisilvae]|uniref:hypothetical protein n=1 Tax=Catenulispora pinisilvae TaxID=2705253 RepID=UPI001891C58E|nr:hypothetical protein [Catenulispora pinisilvae]